MHEGSDKWKEPTDMLRMENVLKMGMMARPVVEQSACEQKTKKQKHKLHIKFREQMLIITASHSILFSQTHCARFAHMLVSYVTIFIPDFERSPKLNFCHIYLVHFTILLSLLNSEMIHREWPEIIYNEKRNGNVVHENGSEGTHYVQTFNIHINRNWWSRTRNREIIRFPPKVALCWDVGWWCAMSVQYRSIGWRCCLRQATNQHNTLHVHDQLPLKIIIRILNFFIGVSET